MDEEKGKVETVPSLGISVETQYAGGRKAVFQTFVERSATEEEINAILDKVNAVADRAEAFYAQEQARRQLEVEEKALNNFKRRMGDVEENIRTKLMADSGRRNAKLSAQDEMQKKQAFDNISEGERRVAECRKFLEELIRKAGNRDGAPGTTDR